MFRYAGDQYAMSQDCQTVPQSGSRPLNRGLLLSRAQSTNAYGLATLFLGLLLVLSGEITVDFLVLAG